MRTSIILDDELGLRLRRAAKDQGITLSAFLAEAGSAKLGLKTPEISPFELIVETGNGLQVGVDLDKSSELLAAEDQSVYGQ